MMLLKCFEHKDMIYILSDFIEYYIMYSISMFDFIATG